jgi:hypothetical protein
VDTPLFLRTPTTSRDVRGGAFLLVQITRSAARRGKVHWRRGASTPSLHCWFVCCNQLNSHFLPNLGKSAQDQHRFGCNCVNDLTNLLVVKKQVDELSDLDVVDGDCRLTIRSHDEIFLFCLIIYLYIPNRRAINVAPVQRRPAEICPNQQSPAEVRLVEVRLAEVRVAKVRVAEVRPAEVCADEVRVAEVRLGNSKYLIHALLWVTSKGGNFFRHHSFPFPRRGSLAPGPFPGANAGRRGFHLWFPWKYAGVRFQGAGATSC